MTISIALTESQRSLLTLALQIARDKFKENAKFVLTHSGNVRLADQFDKQAEGAKALLIWIGGAENVIIQEGE